MLYDNKGNFYTNFKFFFSGYFQNGSHKTKLLQHFLEIFYLLVIGSNVTYNCIKSYWFLMYVMLGSQPDLIT